MADDDDQAPEIDSPEKLQAWLQDKPVDWAQAIAVRAALRVFPLVLRYHNSPEGTEVHLHRRQLVILQTFRALFVAKAAHAYQNGDSGWVIDAATLAAAARHARAADRAADSALTAAAASAAASVVAYAFGADAAAVQTAFSFAINAAGTAAFAAAGAVAEHAHTASRYDLRADVRQQDTWLAVQNDGLWLKIYVDGERNRLIDQPLWLSFSRDHSRFNLLRPTWVVAELEGFASQEGWGGEWRLIVDWYRALLPKPRDEAPRSLFGEEADIKIATQSDAFWTVTKKRSAEDVLRDIARIGGYPLAADDLEAMSGSKGTVSSEAGLARDLQDALEAVEPQAPAAFRFRWRDNRLEAAPPVDIASDPEGAQILLDETRRKAEQLKARLEGSNADNRVLTSIDGLLSALPMAVEELRPALLRSRTRSVEADAQAYSDPSDQEQFLFPDALAALIDLSETARDLQGYYPSLRDLEAEITALAIDPSRMDVVKAQLDHVVQAVDAHPDIVGPTAVEALHVMESIANEPASSAVRQKRIAEYALVVRNALSSVARVAIDNAFSREARKLATDIYDKARPKVLDGVADGLGAIAKPATIIGIGALIGSVFGPVAGIAAAAAAFGKVDRLMKLADKLLGRWEREHQAKEPQSEAGEPPEATEADDGPDDMADA